MQVKLLVLYCGMHSHVAALAEIVAAGARSAGGLDVAVRRVPEACPQEAASAGPLGSPPVATPEDLADYDGIIFGTPPCVGGPAEQVQDFLSETCSLWMAGALIGKVGSVFTSAAPQHSRSETSIDAFQSLLAEHGMVVVGLPESCRDCLLLDASSPSGRYNLDAQPRTNGLPSPLEIERAVAWLLGSHVADITKWLTARSIA